ncbi:serine/threonine-protein kinase [Asanoa iriomotensis]|uniref:non-specific serine/threonine protein kinase n=1 Tax=Asanoa iriomotensis TaxID=234613 RepID=A0ABQ4C5G4_9ACTN|nr:serine/threonine-protein kinase [Asanoa iriomotensis]GIF58021.1 hypothetical protein Air01nite_41160 [Asanoa iriomotensis]
MSAGTVLADRYVLEEVIGAGGMGRVWRGHDRVLGRPVAVKEILSPPWLAAGAGERWRDGLREAQAASRLRHPNVVAVLDVLQTDRPWIIMEYVAARSLDVVLAERGRFEPRDAARVGLEILAALDAAHRAGVIHRDVKPHNVLLAADGRVVLTDFGLAVIAEGGVTIAQQVLGSPDFVAPECARDGVSTVACDLWSLGATLYALVEGVAPYHRPTAVATLAALAVEPPDPITRAGAMAPVILRLLNRDPRRRPSVIETRRLLRAVLTASTTVPLPPRRRRWAPRGWRAALAAAAACALAGAGTAAAVGRPSRGPQDVPPTPPAVHACLEPARTDATPTNAGPGPYALPAGWVWHPDDAGFTVAVPAAWSRYLVATAVCFQDPSGTRTLAVEPAVTPTLDPTTFWRRTETALRATGTLPGYTKISIGPVLAGAGGAEWESTWDTAGGLRRHARRLVVTTAPSQAYTLSWFTDDADWPLDEPLFRTVATSYRGIT